MPIKIRPIRVEGNTAFIPLTKGYEAMIDVEDVPLVVGFNWSAKPDKNTVYAVRKISRATKQRDIRLHRVIMGEPEGLLVDHRDGDGLNNRRGNLRIATRSQNNCNMRAPAHNTSGHKGVSFKASQQKWVACIKLHGRQKHLGAFSNLDDAVAAYAAASAQVHGEYGRTA